MKKIMWLSIIGLAFLGVFSLAGAKDENPKLEKIYILSLDTEAMTLSIEGMDFWVDAQTKIEDEASNKISLSDLSVGDKIEIWFDRSNLNDAGFIYASKIEID